MALSQFCTGPDPLLFQVCSPFVNGPLSPRVQILAPIGGGGGGG